MRQSVSMIVRSAFRRAPWHGWVLSHRRGRDRLLATRFTEYAVRLNLHDQHHRQGSMLLSHAVWLTFVGPVPAAHRIAHRDGHRANCRLASLVATPRVFMTKVVPACNGESPTAQSGLTAEQARAIAASPDAADAVARAYGIKKWTVYRIWMGQIWAEETADVRRASYKR